ncbi:hypothetical protein, partial [Salinisphaera hydrothermalis]|uniref:hypothetical protein n=1 Tax=Salinisphaera hydrothermalis TaxID=563188 RepID=UPI00333E50DB
MLYRAKHGDSVSQLNEYCFDYTLVARDHVLRALVDENFSDAELRTHGSSFELIFDELRARGEIIEHPDCSYSLTKEGYLEGTKSRSDKFLKLLNRNPGLSIILELYASLVYGDLIKRRSGGP